MDVVLIIQTTITAIFLLYVLSFYVLLFVKRKKHKPEKSYNSITIAIPARNEGPYLKECIESVLQADFKGKKEIIVINDASMDNTKDIALSFKSQGIKLISNDEQKGKSFSLNRALKQSHGQVFAVVDADSIIEKDALTEMLAVVEQKNVAGATGVVRVKNRNKPINMWTHLEQLYNSLLRSLFSKINANITTPGPLSMYRKEALDTIGGFSTEGFSEDVDITIRLIRHNYIVGFCETAIAQTNLPYDRKGFFRQRTRFARGMLNIFKRHLRMNKRLIDLYTLPLLLFGYIQAVIMGSLILHQILSGYYLYFFSKGDIFSLSVARFFFDWFSIFGFAKWSLGVFTGATPLSVLSIVGITSSLLSYPLYFAAIFKFDRKFDFRHLFPIMFMFPFWLLIMMIYIVCLPEFFRKSQYNRWKKNEP